MSILSRKRKMFVPRCPLYNVPMPSPASVLAELVHRPSVNPMGRTDIPSNLTYESRVTDYLESQFRAINANVRRIEVTPGRHNLVATYTPPHATETVLWEAHQDTVPTDGMVVDPFGAEVKGRQALWPRRVRRKGRDRGDVLCVREAGDG